MDSMSPQLSALDSLRMLYNPEAYLQPQVDESAPVSPDASAINDLYGSDAAMPVELSNFQPAAKTASTGSLGQPLPDTSTGVHKEAQSKDHLSELIQQLSERYKPNPDQDRANLLMDLGTRLMANQSPNLFQAIGEAGQGALKTAAEQQKAARDLGTDEIKNQIAVEQFRQKQAHDEAELASQDVLRKAQAHAWASGAKGNGLPAPLQLANEYRRRLADGDIEGAKLIAQFAKTVDKGVEIDANGNYQPASGYASSVGTIQGAKKGAETQAEYDVKQKEQPKLEFNTKTAEKDAAQVAKDQDASGELDNLTFSIKQARSLIPKVSMTGPILGRIGAASEDPDYRNLQGALNSVTLQAKDLYNLGSGQGFTDADRDFLQQTIAGKYAQAETIGEGLDRMEEALKHRQEFLNNRGKKIASKYNAPSPQSDATSNDSGQNTPPTGALEEARRRGLIK